MLAGVSYGSNSEVRAGNREVGYALNNGHRQPSLSGPRSAKAVIDLSAFHGNWPIVAAKTGAVGNEYDPDQIGPCRDFGACCFNDPNTCVGINPDSEVIAVTGSALADGRRLLSNGLMASNCRGMHPQHGGEGAHPFAHWRWHYC